MTTSIAPSYLKDRMTNDDAERIISAAARRSLSPAAEAWLRGVSGPVLSNAYQQFATQDLLPSVVSVLKLYHRWSM